MDRRELLKMAAVLSGGAVVGSQFFLTGCKNGDKAIAGLPLTADQISLLNEVGETIIPTTDSPGAKAADVGSFMNTMVQDCYEEKDQKIFLDGVSKLQTADFMKSNPEEKTAMLTKLDKEAADYNKTKKKEDPAHYFSMIKQLVILGYFTSKPGATEALRYEAVPGRYEGCIPYNKGDKAWAT